MSRVSRGQFLGVIATSQPGNYLRFLQVCRGIAAVSVVLAHAMMMAGDKLGQAFLGGQWMPAAVVVDFFFVLSGFIIFYTHYLEIGQPRFGGRYLYRRLVRIYPLVLVVTVLKLGYLATHAEGIPEFKKGFSYILGSTLLLPQEQIPFIAVTWSLSYELLCYGIFLLLILFGWGLRLWVLAHALACVVLNLPWLPQLDWPVKFIFSPYVLEFYAGGVAAHWFLKRPPGVFTGATCVLVSSPLIVLGVSNYDELLRVASNLHQVYWAVTFFLLVLGAVSMERQTSWRPPRWLCALGDASYSIYLTHTSVLDFGAVLLGWRSAGSHKDQALTIWIISLAAILIGTACYRWIERPLLRWLQGKGPAATVRRTETPAVPRCSQT